MQLSLSFSQAQITFIRPYKKIVYRHTNEICYKNFQFHQQGSNVLIFFNNLRLAYVLILFLIFCLSEPRCSQGTRFFQIWSKFVFRQRTMFHQGVNLLSPRIICFKRLNEYPRVKRSSLKNKVSTVSCFKCLTFFETIETGLCNTAFFDK